MRRIATLVVTLCLCGCRGTLQPGAESVRVVSSEAAIRDASFVDSYSGSCGWMSTDSIDVAAKNFAHARGADLALVKRESSGAQGRVMFTVEAWKSKR